MDPVTHGLIGASVSQSFADREKLRPAALVGAASAMFPDLDIFIDSASDPLLQLEFHRTFSHSFLFIPIGALFISMLLWWFLREKIDFREVYMYSLTGMATAGIADTFTSYGVQLLWPFAAARYSWNLISVFDPLFSLGLLVALGFTLYHKKSWPAQIGLLWMVLYLLFGLSQQYKAKTVAHNLAEENNHHIQELIIKPTIANEVLWNIRYVSEDSLYTYGVQLKPYAEPKIYKGKSTKLLEWHQQYSNYEGTTLYQDIRRFDKLSDGILVMHPDSNQVIGDGRYAMLPTSVTPLWGIKIDTLNADEHVEFNTFRNASKKIRDKFLNMVFK